MVRTHVGRLDVPPSTKGIDAYKNRQPNEHISKKYPVTIAGTPSGGGVRVILQGGYVWAKLNPTAKAVHEGDRAIAQKHGGTWVISEVETWKEPPTVGPPPPSTTPLNAQTATGSTSFTPRSARAADYASSYSSWTSWGDHMVGRYNNDAVNAINLLNNAVSSILTRLNSLQTALNANASRTNEVRDVATGVRSSITGLRDGALQDRMVQE